MNNDRRFSGICVDEYVNDKVYIGGGYRSSQKCEWYNTTKNKWISLNDTNGTHESWPIIWNTNPNVINIASVHHCKIFETNDIRENKWNIIKDNDQFDILFGKKIQSDIDTRLLIST